MAAPGRNSGHYCPESTAAALARLLNCADSVDTVAITTWNEFVSPVFDSARTVTFIAPDGTRESIDVSLLGVVDKAELLRLRHAGILVCGAISRLPLTLLLERGIEVVPYVRGKVAEVHAALINNELLSDRFLLPGCSPMGRQCRTRCRMRRRGGRFGPRRPGSPFTTTGEDGCA
ncbi:MAG: hypothetical protein GF331_10595 [Chitinivibrionales bacterium]|nr:hypothetical protein [Chitinivibrionales bacterium]